MEISVHTRPTSNCQDLHVFSWRLSLATRFCFTVTCNVDFTTSGRILRHRLEGVGAQTLQFLYPLGGVALRCMFYTVSQSSLVGLSSFTPRGELLEKCITLYFLLPSFSFSPLLCQQYRDHLPNKLHSHSNLCTTFCFVGGNPNKIDSVYHFV